MKISMKNNVKLISCLVTFLSVPMIASQMSAPKSKSASQASLNDRLAVVAQNTALLRLSVDPTKSNEADLKRNATSDHDDGDQKMAAAALHPDGDLKSAVAASMIDGGDGEEPEWVEKLFRACGNGDRGTIEKIVKDYGLSSSHFNSEDEDQIVTPLEHCCQSLVSAIKNNESKQKQEIIGVYAESIKYLLDNGARAGGGKLNGGDDEERVCPLTHIARIGNVDLGKLLIDHGARDVNDAINGALAEAVEGRHISFIELILEQGLPSDAQKRRNLLMYACARAYRHKYAGEALKIWTKLLLDGNRESEILEKMVDYAFKLSHCSDVIIPLLDYPLMRTRSNGSKKIMNLIVNRMNRWVSELEDENRPEDQKWHFWELMEAVQQAAIRILGKTEYLRLTNKKIVQELALRKDGSERGRAAGSESSSSSSNS